MQQTELEFIAASAFVNKSFAGDRSYLFDRAAVIDRRTGQELFVGIVINIANGKIYSIPQE